MFRGVNFLIILGFSFEVYCSNECFSILNAVRDRVVDLTSFGDPFRVPEFIKIWESADENRQCIYKLLAENEGELVEGVAVIAMWNLSVEYYPEFLQRSINLYESGRLSYFALDLAILPRTEIGDLYLRGILNNQEFLYLISKVKSKHYIKSETKKSIQFVLNNPKQLLEHNALKYQNETFFEEILLGFFIVILFLGVLYSRFVLFK